MSGERDTVTVPSAARWITMPQLCAARQCSEATVRRGMRNGTIPFEKFGRLVRFPRELLNDGTGPVVSRGGCEIQTQG